MELFTKPFAASQARKAAGTANHEPWGSPVDHENRADRRGRRSHTGQIFEADLGLLHKPLLQSLLFAQSQWFKEFFTGSVITALLLIAAGVATLSGSAAADSSLDMALGAGPRSGEVYVVEADVRDMYAVMGLARRGFDIASVREGTVEIYAVAEELELLEALGYSWRVIGRDGDSTKALGEYNNYASVTALLEDYALAYPAIARLESIGRSVQGRELWVLYITDNPDTEEDEPEFKYVSTIHGDEPVGTEMCLNFIDRLLTDYGKTQRITDLIDSTAIAILPLMNPDGREAVSRYNAQGFDLNRSFPEYPADYVGTAYDGEGLHDAARPSEVAHVMRWTAANRFVLSANFHTGALLVNYPYDEDGVPSGCDAPTPDDLLFEEVSRRYAYYNVPMWNSAVFEDGISNGSAWYAIFGSMQDWNYRYIACNEVTIELSDAKWPAASTLAGFWDDNREAMLHYLEAVHIGVRGVVTDAVSGEPLHAKITVEGNAQPVFTDPEVGDYHRMLLPGTYTLTIEAEGYSPRTIDAVNVTDGPATRADAALAPADTVWDADVDNSGEVDARDVQLVVNAALAIAVPYDCDINDDGETDALDVQLAVNAVFSE